MTRKAIDTAHPQLRVDAAVGTHPHRAAGVEDRIAAGADVGDHVVVGLDGGARLEFFGDDGGQRRRCREFAHEMGALQHLGDIGAGGQEIELDRRSIGGVGGFDLDAAETRRPAG